jgi:hypothetical protein
MRSVFLATVAVLAFSVPAWPQELPAPQIKEQGPIRYVQGGVGEEERQMLQALKKDFGLELIFAAKGGGNFLADVDLTIRDAKGQEVLRTTVDAPIFMAQLPPGRYTVEAQYDGQVQKRSIAVKSKGTQQMALYFNDPSSRETIGMEPERDRTGGGAARGASRAR